MLDRGLGKRHPDTIYTEFVLPSYSVVGWLIRYIPLPEGTGGGGGDR